MTAFALAFARVAGVAAAAWAAGWFASPAVCPSDPEFRAERAGWSWAIGVALAAAMVPLALFVGATPGWAAFGILGLLGIGAGAGFRVSSAQGAPAAQTDAMRAPRDVRLPIGLVCLVALGVALYALRALTEPMWSNDYIAIWGLKGKTVHAAGAIPRRLFEDPALGFSHPEYPLGLPFLYAGVSFLTGRWDDHALALLFPIFQVATLAVLVGWLRRHGASRGTALVAAATLVCFEPLYTSFMTGMAEVPLSFGLLLFGTALADALEGDSGALRRLAAASALIAATKNEGLFYAAAGCAIAALFGGSRRWRVALAALPTALFVHGLHVAALGRLPLRDFDVASVSLARTGEALAAALRLPGAVGWAELLLLAALAALGVRGGAGDRMLGLCACGLAAYLLLPAFAVRGPEWLVQTALPRTSAALAPLAAGAVAIRLARPAD